jgi:hypothetical protein
MGDARALELGRLDLKPCSAVGCLCGCGLAAELLPFHFLICEMKNFKNSFFHWAV